AGKDSAEQMAVGHLKFEFLARLVPMVNRSGFTICALGDGPFESQQRSMRCDLLTGGTGLLGTNAQKLPGFGGGTISRMVKEILCADADMLRAESPSAEAL